MSVKVDKRRACPVTRYAQRVVAGKIVAGKMVRLACQRHLDDLNSAAARGLYFDRAEAERVISFFELLRHTKGEWAGLRVELGDWQKFIVGSIFGWKWAATGLRRFVKAYEEVARKNGKSTKCAGIALYLLTADKEPGAEVYTAATKKDQARIVFDEASTMIKALPSHYELRQVVSVYENNLIVERTGSKMLPLSADAKTMDGLNPHGCVIDELHAHQSRAVYDILDTAFGSRRQPLLFAITTAGFDRHSVCWDERDYAVKVLEGVIKDDTLFAYIATLDEGDDPFDEKVWIKANPNLGVSKKLDYMRQQAAKAREVPTFYNKFLRLHLNIWTESATRWLSLEVWDACKGEVKPLELRDRPCFGGLDLSSNTDISAYVKVWPPIPADPLWRCEAKFWLPKDDLDDRIRRDRVPYDVWARDGHLMLTEGNTIDHNFIQAQIEDDWDEYKIVDIGVDRHNATMIVSRLMDYGVKMVGFGQGFLSMSPAAKQLELIILAKQLAHGGNPVLRWMMSNIVMKLDPAGNIKPDKEKSINKIDGIVALIMAIGRANDPEANKAGGFTATHGVMTI